MNWIAVYHSMRLQTLAHNVCEVFLQLERDAICWKCGFVESDTIGCTKDLNEVAYSSDAKISQTKCNVPKLLHTPERSWEEICDHTVSCAIIILCIYHNQKAISVDVDTC